MYNSEGNIIASRDALLRRLIFQAPVAISVVVGLDFRIEILNKKQLELWRKEEAEVLHKPLFVVFPELKSHEFEKLLTKVYNTGVPFVGKEIPAQLFRNGTLDTAYFDFSYDPMRNQAGEVEGIIVISTEVTENVMARKKIEASDVFTRNILESSPDCLKVLDAEGCIQYMNYNGLCQMEIDDFSTVKDKSWAGFWGSENEGLVQSSINKALTGATAQFTALCPTAKGTPKWWDVIVSPLSSATDGGQQIIAVSRDITEQKNAQRIIAENESRLRIFADSIQNLAWIAKGDGWIYWYNRRWYDYTGTNLSEMEGWGWEKVHHPDHVDKVKAFFKEAWKKGEAVEITFPLRRHDGEYRWFLTRAYPVKDINGNTEQWIGTNTDIHEQKTKDQQRDDFISIASHEMKTPLTTAKGYIDLLLHSLPPEDQHAAYAAKAKQSLEKLNNLVTELVDVSKIQNGQLNYTISMFDFNTMVDETIEDMQYSPQTHRIQKNGHCSRQVSGDYGRLQQVLINLLSNAIKYSPNADKVIVTIKEEENQILLSVKDYGVGMSDQYLDKIFERYYRVHSEALNFQGLGIGLYISSNIIKRHNGKLWAESEFGKGSTFYFTVPV